MPNAAVSTPTADAHAVPAVTRAPAANPAAPTEPALVSPSPDAPLVEAELLVEDVSIDGMCGVY